MSAPTIPNAYNQRGDSTTLPFGYTILSRFNSGQNKNTPQTMESITQPKPSHGWLDVQNVTPIAINQPSIVRPARTRFD